jgi:hypothetical protein
MSVNKHQPHVLVLPEDDANRQIATGFVQEFKTRQIQALPVAGGWREVLSIFESDHLTGMDKYPDRLIVLLIDFDCRDDRLAEVKCNISPSISDRVFVLGAWAEPQGFEE